MQIIMQTSGLCWPG